MRTFVIIYTLFLINYNNSNGQIIELGPSFKYLSGESIEPVLQFQNIHDDIESFSNLIYCFSVNYTLENSFPLKFGLSFGFYPKRKIQTYKNPDAMNPFNIKQKKISLFEMESSFLYYYELIQNCNISSGLNFNLTKFRYFVKNESIFDNNYEYNKTKNYILISIQGEISYKIIKTINICIGLKYGLNDFIYKLETARDIDAGEISYEKVKIKKHVPYISLNYIL